MTTQLTDAAREEIRQFMWKSVILPAVPASVVLFLAGFFINDVFKGRAENAAFVQAYSRINDLDAQASKRNEELQTALIAAKSETANTQKRLAEIETILARFKTLEGELTALKAEMENVTQRLNGDAFRLQLARDLAADEAFKKTVGGEVDSLTTKCFYSKVPFKNELVNSTFELVHWSRTANDASEQSVQPEPRAARFLTSTLVGRGPVNRGVRQSDASCWEPLETHAMISDKQRGMLFLGFGVFFSLVFLVGGGVVTSTNGAYWTTVFAGSFAMGLTIAGPWVYRSAKANRRATTTGHQQPRAAYYVGLLIFGLASPLFLMLFRSDLFLSSPVQHGFMIGMGFCLAQFVPLGLGFLAV